MIHQVVTRVSLDSFKDRSQGKKIVLLYPWTNYRNLFLSHFLASAKDGLLYYRIPADNLALREWLADMATEMDAVLSGFGGNLKAALENNAPEAGLGQALAADLADYNRNHLILFIDELDRLPFDENFEQFIMGLVEAMADHTQIAFSSRLLTQQPWYNLVANGTAIILGTEYRKNDVMFTVEDTPRPQLEVYAFGRGHAVVNGQEINNWDGALPRNLFFYFVDNPLVTRDDIFDTFWPNLSVKEATNVFHVTKRKISERISHKVEGQGENYELTLYASGFYMPSDKVMRHYDVDDFQEAVERATTSQDPREQEILYRRAIDLYKAPFLETIDMPWVTERRRHLRQLYAQALIGLARLHMKRDEKELALGLYSRTLKETPQREDIHREVIKLYVALGMPEDARHQYHLLEKILKEEFDTAPTRESRALYDSIGR